NVSSSSLFLLLLLLLPNMTKEFSFQSSQIYAFEGELAKQQTSCALLIATIDSMARTLFCLLNIVAKLCFFFYHAIARNTGFTIDLIRRDSPNSPFYDPKNTLTPERSRRHAHLGLNGDHFIIKAPSFNVRIPQSHIFPDNGQYVMKLGLGSPPVDIYALADTGSDLFWTQCLPCDSCYQQKNPKYDPRASATYKDIQCQSQQCHLLDTVFCSAPPAIPNLCNYTYGYASASLTQGFLATEKITLTSNTGQPVSIPNIVFGCGHNNTGGFNENEMGLIGLGKGPISFISQMGSAFGARRFSQCLVPFHTDPSISSKMSFGVGSEVKGPGVVSTPMVHLQDPTYYFATLYGISIGDKYLPFNSSGTVSKGNMFLDSGTPPTIVPTDFYNRLESEVRSQVKLTPIDDPQLRPQLCYGNDIQAQGPILTAHFDRNADLKLTQKSIFIEAKPGIFCFAMVPTNSSGSIYGNFVRTDYLIGFDTDKNVISFKQTDCTKQ
ncbi:aspartic proteinase CDR1-like, partial [Punica granatum]|uniref:Aspartic proteinase CDR1-like n=2 Tax=Punica granatum TaxID=22663 RepID=A0A6P8DCZ0_PUNGR